MYSNIDIHCCILVDPQRAFDPPPAERPPSAGARPSGAPGPTIIL